MLSCYMKCPHCGQEHPDNFQFCPVTGQRISSMQACRNEDCKIFGQYILPPEARYCPKCGRPLKDVSGGTSTDGNTEESVLEFEVNGVSFKMIRVEHGTFMMGATDEQEDPYDDEQPVHRVTLTKDYYIGETPVTQALWEAVMGDNPSDFVGDDHPVECVSWYDCQDFIEKLNEMTGKHFRLPTEAEWEYAARGGNCSLEYQYSGNDDLDEVAWYEDNSDVETHPVAQLEPNELGLYDMSGNVWEWCEDWYGDYRSGAQTNPKGPSSGSYRVFRGGSWDDDARCCRLSYRISNTPGYAGSILGFRLAFSE